MTMTHFTTRRRNGIRHPGSGIRGYDNRSNFGSRIPNPGSRVAVLLAFVTVAILAGCESSPTKPSPALYEVRIGEASWQVELAVTEPQQRLGLGWRSQLPVDRGMLFLYDTPHVMGFWMKNCLISLDIAFIDADGRIVKIHTMTHEPLDTPNHLLKTYSSEVPVQFALEVPANALRNAGVRVGDVVVFDPKIPIPTPGKQ